MKKGLSHKAISDIITTVLLILVSIIGILVLWYYVKNQVIVDADISRLDIDIRIQNVVLVANEARISLTRNPGAGNVTGFIFKFTNNDDSYNEQVNVSIKELETQIFKIDLVGKIVPTKVFVAPIVITSKGKLIYGDFTDSLKIVSCTPNCAGKQCGSDSCLGSCGTCSSGACNSLGRCV